MKTRQILQELYLGSSVAEHDDDLKHYFIQHNAFFSLIKGRSDIIAGDKGTGKTAIYKYLIECKSSIKELSNIEIIPGFNPTGNPIFRQLTDKEAFEERDYTNLWKIYFLSLVGNWILKLFQDSFSGKMAKLDKLLNRTNLRADDDSAKTVFTSLLKWVDRIIHPKAAGLEFGFEVTGMPTITPKIEFQDFNRDGVQDANDITALEDSLALLQDVLEETATIAWIVIDRLDEAFIGYPDIEIPALRGLLRAYLDMMAFENIGLKLFLRKDLFRRIVKDGFVNLTHVNARKIELIWEEEDLKSLLWRRVRQNKILQQTGSDNNLSLERFLQLLLPKHMGVGARKPATWTWIVSRIRDGNHVLSPRNLIDLINFAIEEQLRREQRNPSYYKNDTPLLNSESLIAGYKRLSDHRVNDTILAEADKEISAFVKAFRDNKSHHNLKSIAKLFGVDETEARFFTNVLVDIGFLEMSKDGYRIPQLYRAGLNISTAKAY